MPLPLPGCVIVGRNGHGKTSFLEALVYAQLYRSFRGAADRELVRFGDDGFHLALELAEGKGQVTCGYDARTRHKKVTVNGTERESLTQAIGIVRGVVLSPGDVLLIAGGPKERRRWLDVQLALTVRGYVEALTRYRRSLAQRGRAHSAEAEGFEEVLAESGAVLIAARQAWAARWAGDYARHCAAVGERGTALLEYRPRTAGGVGELRDAFARSRARDRELGQTTVGPHRDDVRLTLEGRDLRTWGSAGQQRTAALALRLLEAATIAAGGGWPVIGLDDAFAELDGERSERLGGLIGQLAEGGAQVVAAVPRATDLPPSVAVLERWRIGDGILERA